MNNLKYIGSALMLASLLLMAVCLAPPKFWRASSAATEKGAKPADGEEPALKT